MTDPDEAEGSRVFASALDQLHEARVLHAQIKGLKALLQLQRNQVARLNDRLYANTPGGHAARRLLDLKRSEKP
ncbi:hypothetical protein [Microvirga puerhi]|uniref:Uncharacterized protein n=1 Tax=Microvirga puerhi TaxID=2876078 RepID=A0ABS7VKY1_9HYPH|nr:hypothetical protein [Microvirga puerhi]MBZ6076181.1 hypothetical protein [Microvirga puerhi]